MKIEDQEHKFSLPWRPSSLLIQYLQRTRFLMNFNIEISYAERGLFNVRIIPIYFQHPEVTREIMTKLCAHLLPVFTDRPWSEFVESLKPREVTALVALRALMRQQKKSRLTDVKLDHDAMERIYAFARVDPSYKPFVEIVQRVRQLVTNREAKSELIRGRDLKWIAKLPPEIVDKIAKQVPNCKSPLADQSTGRLLRSESENIRTLIEMRAVNRMFATFVDSCLSTTNLFVGTKNKLIFAHNDQFFMDFTRRTWDEDEVVRTPFADRSVHLFGQVQPLRVLLCDYNMPTALELVRKMIFELKIREVQIDFDTSNKFSAEERELMTRFVVEVFNSWPQLQIIRVYAELVDADRLWQLDWPLDESRMFQSVPDRKYVLSIRL